MRWPGGDARGRVAARRARDPVVEVARGQRDVARRAGRAAGRVDADDLGTASAQRCAPIGLLRRAGRRAARASRSAAARAMSASPPASRPRRPAPRASRGRRPSARGGRRAARGRRVVERELLGPRARLDLGLEHQPVRLARTSIASSAAPAIRKPTGLLALLGEVGEQAGGAGEQRDRLHRGRREAEVEHAPPRSASRRSSSAACPRPRRPRRGTRARARRAGR